MTELRPQDPVPGSWLLTLGRVIFDDAVFTSVIQPTVADLQRELRDAGSSRRQRLLAHCRGHRAFWTLAFVAPFAFWRAPAPGHGAVAFPDVVGRAAVTVIILTLVTLNGSALGIWTIVAGIGGTCVAIGMHAWYGRHPSLLVVADTDIRHRPQINLASIPVHANAGGLIFVVGSVAIVVLGLPALRWFLLAAVVLGAVVAWALLAWHASHPLRGLPQNQIVLR